MGRISFKRYIFVLTLACLTMGGIVTSAHAQWQTTSGPIFLSHDSQQGCAVCYSDGLVWAGANNLWQSTDLGLSWQQVAAFGSDTVLNIVFFDRLHGTVFTRSAVNMTTDGGLTWKKLLKDDPADHWTRWGAYGMTSDTLYIVFSGEFLTIVKGVIANRAVGNIALSPVCARAGTIHCLEEGQMFSSNNAGTTFSQRGTTGIDCNAMALDSCDYNILYLVNEEIFHNATPSIFVSHDAGLTWNSNNPQTPNYYAGNLASSKNALYTQTQGGILRSQDQGNTWTAIGGPAGPPDNLSLCVAADSVLLVIDTFGKMWRTYNDGGSPPMIVHTAPTLLSSDRIFSSDTVSLCDGPRDSVIVVSKCGAVNLTAIQIIGADSHSYTSKQIASLQNVDTFSITYTPSDTTKKNATLLLIYNTTDTLAIALGAVAVHTAPTLLSSNQIFLHDTLTICDDPRDSVIIISKCGTASLTALKLIGPDTASYAAQQIASTPGIDTFGITFTPGDTTKKNATLLLIYNADTIAVSLGGIATPPLLPALQHINDTLFTWAKLYTCEMPVPDSTLILINCQKRKLDSTQISGLNFGNYAVLRTARDTADGQDSIFLSFHPSAPGASVGMLTAFYHDGSRITVPLQGLGLADPVAQIQAINVQLLDTLGATVRVPIIVTHDRALSGIDFRLTFDTSVLIFNRFAFPNDSTLASDSSLGAESEYVHMPIHYDTIPDTIYAYFYWFPTTDSLTIAFIDQVQPEAIGPGCTVLANTTTQSRITGPITCVTSMLSSLTRYGGPIYFYIQPNPAATAIEIQIPSDLRGAFAGARLTIADDMGRRIYSGTLTSAGIDVKDFPPGLYHLDLETNALRMGREFLILR